MHASTGIVKGNKGKWGNAMHNGDSNNYECVGW